ncbi:Alpha/Beta hydrolase protein [Mycena vulgaris]|nr:Alpha/Beta hydrolase protein [Mycena vulgaris]
MVILDAGTFTGTAGSVNTQSFLDIPFAKPPVGDLRFRLTVAIPAYTGTHDATAMGLSCPQQEVDLLILTVVPAEVINSIFGLVVPDSEECLTINVVKPASATAASKLPVVAWIFAGGFELGSPAMYDGNTIVERSVAMRKPVVYASMNYRVSNPRIFTAFGFLASVGKLGLQDHATSGVEMDITTFGGDPTKVIMYAPHPLRMPFKPRGDTEGLFRGGFMQSGSPIPVGPVGPVENGQKYYDAIVDKTGCEL